MSYPRNTQRPEPPLAAPYYGVSVRKAVARVFAKPFTFSGRASRSEYWWWVLVTSFLYLPLQLLIGVFTRTNAQRDRVTEPAGIFFQCLLVTIAVIWFLPTLSLTVRRLHDANISGWAVLAYFVPAIIAIPFGGLATPPGLTISLFGDITLLILTLLPANPRGQRFDTKKAHKTFRP